MSNIPPRPRADKAMILTAATVVAAKIGADTESTIAGTWMVTSSLKS